MGDRHRSGPTAQEVSDLWAEAMAHVDHSQRECSVCHGEFMWKPAALNAHLDAEWAKHNDDVDCACLRCQTMAAVAEAVRPSAAHCDTCASVVRVYGRDVP